MQHRQGTAGKYLMNNSVNFDLSHSFKGTLRAPAASPTESRGPFIRERKNNSSFLVLSLCCFKRKTIPGHQNFHGHRPNPSRKPSLCLVYNILDFRAFLAVWALCDWGPLTSPTSLSPDTSLVIRHFSQHSGLLFPTPSPASLPCTLA